MIVEKDTNEEEKTPHECQLVSLNMSSLFNKCIPQHVITQSLFQQPSSSGRMAEHLGGATGFVGFSALQDLGYVPAALQGSPSDDSTISAEFRVALRKMSKKDATTKIKVCPIVRT